MLHRQPSIFGDDAEAYRPERWLEGTKQMEAYYMQVCDVPLEASSRLLPFVRGAFVG